MKFQIFCCLLWGVACSEPKISPQRKVVSLENSSVPMTQSHQIEGVYSSNPSNSSSAVKENKEVVDNAMIKICIDHHGGEEACRQKYGSWQVSSQEVVVDVAHASSQGDVHSLSLASRALLSVIGEAEGTKERYDIIFSFQTFTSFKDHPRRVICSGGYCSDASGRYQFLSTTWDETKKAISVSDFSPKSQDLGAIYRIETFRGVKNHAQKLSLTQFEGAIYKLNREWASFPGSPYGQPRKSMSELWKVYASNF